jgi:hypothetical protein
VHGGLRHKRPQSCEIADGRFVLDGSSDPSTLNDRAPSRQRPSTRLDVLGFVETADADGPKAIVGTPEMVADRLHGLRKELGLAGILAEMNCGGLIPQERMMRSLQLMCEKCSHGFIEICRVYRSQRGERPRPPLHLSQVIQVRPALREKVIPSSVRRGGILLPNLIQNALFCSLPMGNRSGQVDAASSVY